MYDKRKKCTPISPKVEEETLRLVIPKQISIQSFIKAYEELILRKR